MKSAIARGILVTFLLVCFAFEDALARPAEGDYFVEKNYLQQIRNDFLFCGDIAIAACSVGTIGCRVRLSTDVTKKFVHQSFTCINEDKTEGLKVGYKIELPKARTINIDLDIYITTESSYSVGYGLGGDEYANGVIALNKLDELKKTFRREKKRVDDANT